MKWGDLLNLSVENLRRRIGRTLLTIIGVVVGTCSIIVMMSFGIAMNEGFDEMIQQWGDLTQISVYNWGEGNTSKLTDAVVQEINDLEHVTVATPMYSSRYLTLNVTAGKNDRYAMQYAQVVGIYPAAIEALGFTMISGHGLPETATVSSGSQKKIQVLLGQKTGYAFSDTKRRGEKAQRYEGQTDANGNELPPFVNITTDKITAKTAGGDNAKNFSYTLDVVGVMEEDYKKGYVTSQGIVMDLTVLKRLEKEYMKANNIKASQDDPGYDQVTVKVDDVDNVEAVNKIIQEDFGYSTYSMSSERENMQQQSQSMQMVLGGLGAVSLFVAALSIANTMTMAIYERTREIGVMKVLGCRLSKIRTMFLLEAGMIGFIGGLIGVALSALLAFLLNTFAPMLMSSGIGNFLPMYGTKISVIPVWLALTGLIFSTLIGLLSGIAPANRAVKISALEAIRHE